MTQKEDSENIGEALVAALGFESKDENSKEDDTKSDEPEDRLSSDDSKSELDDQEKNSSSKSEKVKSDNQENKPSNEDDETKESDQIVEDKKSTDDSTKSGNNKSEDLNAVNNSATSKVDEKLKSDKTENKENKDSKDKRIKFSAKKSSRPKTLPNPKGEKSEDSKNKFSKSEESEKNEKPSESKFKVKSKKDKFKDAKPKKLKPLTKSSNSNDGKVIRKKYSGKMASLQKTHGGKILTEVVVGDRSKRLKAKKVRRVIRHIDPWSVLTFSAIFNIVFYSALFIAGLLIFVVASWFDMIDQFEGIIRQMGDYETYEIRLWPLALAMGLLSAIMVIVSTMFFVILSVIFNLISDLVGGIRVTVVEENIVSTKTEDS